MVQIEPLVTELTPLYGDRITTNPTICEHHGKDESWHPMQAPDAVCFPATTEEVAAAVKACAEHRIPIIPFGAGSNVEGQVIAVQGGLCIDLSRMQTIIRVSPEDMDCTVEAGVTRSQLNSYLRETGLQFPIDPGADASLGGMAATRASGTNAVCYGTMRENVLSLRVVLPSGEIIETGGRARKSSAGYDLTHLMVGSEGTLGIITEVTLKLHPRPEAVSAARVQFDSVEAAANAVIETLQCAIPVARIELLDAAQIAAINAYSKTSFAEMPTLFVEFIGSPSSVQEQAELFGTICSQHECSAFDWTADSDERSQMWKARHDAAYAAGAIRPGCSAVATDVCVPISRLAECIGATRADADQHCKFPTMLAGHVGDGNFHFVYVVDPNKPDEVRVMHECHERLIERVLAMGGTCTGEHGIGLGKQKYMLSEFGAATLGAMQAIKTALDPHGIMNPGKKLPDPTTYH
ncbi:D-lactate dehydrogenase (cytochrome) 1 [Luminiphilus syltensis NOR5-1B]|uniref:D-lactate dehydrogenase (cytochrome) n=1 Tax=Luminiphilus syltensis NOR5-1B TaxID=565045 RepID=B8KTW7_9GAMM|nr:FAD-linked oxidase C-terminal domain-containing protein [Luminiphilus syltensis]EED36398.1 D-lactate dehydrogenase (cytochrome) 1 [Luminiphilus syltensis NOR5-1B]